MLKAPREVSGAEALYNIVRHIRIVSSSVLLYTYLFGEPHELEKSQERLRLVQLRSYWSSVEMMVRVSQHQLVLIYANSCADRAFSHLPEKLHWVDERGIL